jgi:regulatory protein
MNAIQFTKEQAVQKIKQYCAYQERCHVEVKEKLYSFNLYKKETNEIIAQLIQENYLNEERFATQFAGGKFRIKRWGKVKIKHALKQRQVSEYVIKKALAQISETDYNNALNKIAAQKLKTLKSEKNIFIKKRKLKDYLLQKGYEAKSIVKIINSPQT